MSGLDTGKKSKPRFIISLIACILIGITFVMSGSGKLIDFGVIPGQTAEFIGYVLPDSWVTPVTVFIIYDIFIPWILPIAELAIGLLILAGFVPRLLAVLCLPLTLLLMANNIFSISIGMSEYASCSCFGIWEQIFGTLTPFQSMFYDIALFALALVILIVFPGRFLESQKWLSWQGKKKENSAKEG
jgi:uncharacterized membrane protein YphA (DoxX/SURF4 family)